MQLAITALGPTHPNFIAELLPAISDCKCSVVEIRSSRLAQATAVYLLAQGNWNQIAKLENTLELLRKRLNIKISSLRPEPKDKSSDCLPYSLETISLDRDHVIEAISTFLLDRGVEIEDINGSCYQAPYIQTSVFSTKFILLIPPDIQLISLREEFLDFCDQTNIDAIIEPIKR